MIREIQTYDECRNFVSGYVPQADDRLLSGAQVHSGLHRALEEPDRHCVLGTWRAERMTGVFSFLVLRQERYLEMLVGLSHEGEACGEMLRALEERFPGYQVDFVFSPCNGALKGQLDLRGAVYEPEQQKMVLRAPFPAVNTDGIALLSDRYAEQYCAIHSRDVYWTGERVLAAQDRFRTFLAIDQGKVVGYLDVTAFCEENEPFDVLVLEAYRRRGYGRKLLAKALESNGDKGMMLHVDVENTPAIRLYNSMGFETAPGENSLTACWTVPGKTN